MKDPSAPRILFFFALAAGMAWGQTPGFGVSLNLKHAGELSGTTPGYNSATEQLDISGTVTFPATANPADYHLRVQNQGTLMSATVDPLKFNYARPIPMGPTPPPTGWGGWAFAGHFSDINRISKPVLAEVVHTATNEVMARTRVVLLDKRFHVNMETQSLLDEIPDSLGMEVTARGLDRLENLTRSAMPQTSLSAFNSRLTSAFLNGSNTVAMDTTLNNVGGLTPKACVPLNQLSSEFRNTTAYRTFEGEVMSSYWLYRGAESQVQNGSIPALISVLLGPVALASLAVQGGAAFIYANSCVTDFPQVAHYELCASSLRGDTRSLEISSVSNVNLSVGALIGLPPASVLASNEVANLKGEIDATMQNLFFRYSRNPGSTCLSSFRPRTNLPTSQVPTNSVMYSQISCPRISLTANTATQATPSEFQFNEQVGNQSDIEKHSVDHFSSPNSLFTLGAARTNNTQAGICREAGVAHNANTLLDRFYGRARSSLDTAWKEGAPQTQQAKALDLVFSKWESGIYGDANLIGTRTGADHQMTNRFRYNSSYNLTDRLLLRYSSDVLGQSGNLGSPWVYPEPETYPCESLGNPCGNNRDFFGNFADASYSVTTGALNQVLRRLAVTPLLTQDWQPTYDQMGIVPPPGTPGSAPAVLNGTNLAQLNPSFISLGNNVATLRFTPTILPYTYIFPEQPVTVPLGRAPLTYQMPQYKMELVSTAPGPYGDGVWLSAIVDFYDPDFNLEPASAPPAADRLVPTMSGNRSSQVTVLRNSFLGCALGPVLAPAGPGTPHPTCAQQLGTALFNPYRDLMVNNLNYMLSRYPAPVRFDAGGQGSPTLVFTRSDIYKWANVITIYGNLQ